DVTGARSFGQFLWGPQDVYNARFAAKKSTKSVTNSDPLSEQNREVKMGNMNEVDGRWQLLEKAKREEAEGNGSTFIRECRIHPDFLCVLASNRQLNYLKHFCTNGNDFCVLGIDPTFNIFQENISLTVMTYRNLKLHHNATKKSPVFIGPLLNVHQRKDWKTYSRFANSLIAEYPDNIKRELERRNIPPREKKVFLNEIFGKEEEEVKFLGLVDSNDEDDFQNKQENLEELWNTREAQCGGSNRDGTFYEWFVKEKATQIKESMLKPIRIEAGLGNIPREYTNNDPEAANFMIKHALKFDA
ncbi:Hypothetical predicted protein, partial [Paramuricea clavata]